MILSILYSFVALSYPSKLILLAPTPLVKIYLRTEHQVSCDDEFSQPLC